MQNREVSRKMREDMIFEMSFKECIVLQADDQRKDASGKENSLNKAKKEGLIITEVVVNISFPPEQCSNN